MFGILKNAFLNLFNDWLSIFCIGYDDLVNKILTWKETFHFA